MGIHQIGHLLSMDCVSGDGTTMELELLPPGGIGAFDTSCAGRIVIRNDRETLATIELDQERIDRLRAFLREEHS